MKKIMNKYIHYAYQFISDPKYRFFFLEHYGFLNYMSDKKFLKKKFYLTLGEKLDFNNVQTFNEKLQWLKIYDRNPIYTTMVDKFKVRKFIAENIGEKYLIPLLGVWNDPKEIDFAALPEQFVLKCNHNSGLGMCICKDKSQLNIKKVKKDLKRGLKQNYYLTGREWPYKNVPRKIIAEKYLENSKNEELIDYKVHNFNGVPKVILVCSQRFSNEGLREDFYNTEWEKLKLKRPEHPNSNREISKPINLKEMLFISQKLSKGFPFMRTDFYEVNGKLYFGEITFYPASGFEKFLPSKWDEVFGSWIILPKMKS